MYTHTHTHTHTTNKPICEDDDVTILWNQGVYADREVNRPDIIIKNKKEKTCILIDVAIPAGQKCDAKGSRKETKIQKFMYTATTNVEHEMYDYTNYKWSHQNNNNKRF